jgi:hypothetical protein
MAERRRRCQRARARSTGAGRPRRPPRSTRSAPSGSTGRIAGRLEPSREGWRQPGLPSSPIQGRRAPPSRPLGLVMDRALDRLQPEISSNTSRLDAPAAGGRSSQRAAPGARNEMDSLHELMPRERSSPPASGQ